MARVLLPGGTYIETKNSAHDICAAEADYIMGAREDHRLMVTLKNDKKAYLDLRNLSTIIED